MKMKHLDQELLLGGGRKKTQKPKRLKEVFIFCALSFFLVLFYAVPMYRNYTNCVGYRCDIVYMQVMNERVQLPSGYLVHTPGCKIWDMDPLDKSVKQYIHTSKKLNCGQPIITLKSGTNKLVYNPDYKQSSRTQCCFRAVYRVSENPVSYTKKADNLFRRSEKCTKIPREGIDVTHEFIQTECIVDEKKNSKTAVDYLAIPLAPELQSNKTQEKLEFWQVKGAMSVTGDLQNSTVGTSNTPEDGAKETGTEDPKTNLPPSVLIFGIDSISRMHMMRSLPKTRQFLLANNFVELQGYTKIGENTFPNMMGALNGMELDQYPCWGGKSKKIDDCPFIWKNFSSRNYVTAFLEDSPDLAIFNYYKVGFVEQPVDYYLRPVTVAYSSKEIRKFKGCVSGMTQTDFILKYIDDFVKTMKDRVPYFLFSWFTSVGHDDFNNLKNFDSRYLSSVKRAVEDENAIILFISDHGYRFGKFRETFLGYYEESLPFFYVRLPPKLAAKYPGWEENLRVNAHRLLSPLDLHETFKQILTLSEGVQVDALGGREKEGSSLETTKTPGSNPPHQYYSFFETVPVNRTCESAGIPSLYCRCGVNPNASPMASGANVYAELVVKKVNEILDDRVSDGTCVALKFKKILYFREIGSGDAWNHFGRLVHYTDFLVALETSPSGAHFEAMLRSFPHNATVSVIGDVSRINSYQGQNECLKDYALKNYCMCKDYYEAKEAKTKSKKG